MKKILSILLTFLIALSTSTITAFADDISKEPISYDISISEDELKQLEYVEIETEDSSKSGNLIYTKKMLLAKDGTTLVINGETKFSSEVVKCGFSYIKIQQYKGGKWVDYKTFKDIYSDSSACKCAKKIAGVKGYKYRVVTKHYAKKSLLNTETIVSTTATISL